ncbi:unnamed protein product [Amoebophrya sp. A120]|nr:unnamed protein product [Amoebophrya sp. A120]|eukprot:GSA120T00010039001.1
MSTPNPSDLFKKFAPKLNKNKAKAGNRPANARGGSSGSGAASNATGSGLRGQQHHLLGGNQPGAKIAGLKSNSASTAAQNDVESWFDDGARERDRQLSKEAAILQKKNMMKNKQELGGGLQGYGNKASSAARVLPGAASASKAATSATTGRNVLNGAAGINNGKNNNVRGVQNGTTTQRSGSSAGNAVARAAGSSASGSSAPKSSRPQQLLGAASSSSHNQSNAFVQNQQNNNTSFNHGDFHHNYSNNTMSSKLTSRPLTEISKYELDDPNALSRPTTLPFQFLDTDYFGGAKSREFLPDSAWAGAGAVVGEEDDMDGDNYAQLVQLQTASAGGAKSNKPKTLNDTISTHLKENEDEDEMETVPSESDEIPLRKEKEKQRLKIKRKSSTSSIIMDVDEEEDPGSAEVLPEWATVQAKTRQEYLEIKRSVRALAHNGIVLSVREEDHATTVADNDLNEWTHMVTPMNIPFASSAFYQRYANTQNDVGTLFVYDDGSVELQTLDGMRFDVDLGTIRDQHDLFANDPHADEMYELGDMNHELVVKTKNDLPKDPETLAREAFEKGEEVDEEEMKFSEAFAEMLKEVREGFKKK